MWHATSVSAVALGNLYPLRHCAGFGPEMPRGCFAMDFGNVILNGFDALRYRTFMIVVVNEFGRSMQFEVFLKDPDVMKNSVINIRGFLA